MLRPQARRIPGNRGGKARRRAWRGVKNPPKGCSWREGVLIQDRGGRDLHLPEGVMTACRRGGRRSGARVRKSTAIVRKAPLSRGARSGRPTYDPPELLATKFLHQKRVRWDAVILGQPAQSCARQFSKPTEDRSILKKSLPRERGERYSLSLVRSGLHPSLARITHPAFSDSP